MCFFRKQKTLYNIDQKREYFLFRKHSGYPRKNKKMNGYIIYHLASVAYPGMINFPIGNSYLYALRRGGGRDGFSHMPPWDPNLDPAHVAASGEKLPLILSFSMCLIKKPYLIILHWFPNFFDWRLFDRVGYNPILSVGHAHQDSIAPWRALVHSLGTTVINMQQTMSIMNNIPKASIV